MKNITLLLALVISSNAFAASPEGATYVTVATCTLQSDAGLVSMDLALDADTFFSAPFLGDSSKMPGYFIAPTMANQLKIYSIVRVVADLSTDKDAILVSGLNDNETVRFPYGDKVAIKVQSNDGEQKLTCDVLSGLKND